MQTASTIFGMDIPWQPQSGVNKEDFFTNFYKESFQRLTQYVNKRLINKSDSDDVVQETMNVLWKCFSENIIGEPSIMNMQKFMFGCAKNQILNKNSLSYKNKLRFRELTDNQQFYTDITESIDQKQQIQSVSALVNSLSEFEKGILKSYCDGNCSYKRASKLANMSGTVFTRLIKVLIYKLQYNSIDDTLKDLIKSKKSNPSSEDILVVQHSVCNLNIQQALYYCIGTRKFSFKWKYQATVYRNYISRFLKYCSSIIDTPVNQITEEQYSDIIDIFLSSNNQLASSTVRSHLDVIRALLNILVQKGILKENRMASAYNKRFGKKIIRFNQSEEYNAAVLEWIQKGLTRKQIYTQSKNLWNENSDVTRRRILLALGKMNVTGQAFDRSFFESAEMMRTVNRSPQHFKTLRCTERKRIIAEWLNSKVLRGKDRTVQVKIIAKEFNITTNGARYLLNTVTNYIPNFFISSNNNPHVTAQRVKIISEWVKSGIYHPNHLTGIIVSEFKVSSTTATSYKKKALQMAGLSIQSGYQKKSKYSGPYKKVVTPSLVEETTQLIINWQGAGSIQKSLEQNFSLCSATAYRVLTLAKNHIIKTGLLSEEQCLLILRRRDTNKVVRNINLSLIYAWLQESSFSIVRNKIMQGYKLKKALAEYYIRKARKAHMIKATA